ncbi:MAG: UDP-N-acetylmuramoyl-tripeptide--D-alanyl-D-alanine ligase, partial [Paracoccaceae bacterium]|nr:UDP-N-acetylmuramoyl-tripeptide--D-alanyl-D-alanine ligase [Paracoccaceae bacterium]
MSALWTAAEAVRATGGTTTGDWAATGVSIDTRTLQKGELFVALKDVRDGHDFVAQALEKGAVAALVSRRPDGVAKGAPLLIVPDVLKGLEDLGRAGRARSAARVVAVTGSVGKTSTKEMLREVLSGQGRTHAAEASYNNHWGVPLTLARMPQGTEFAVIEVGMNHPGEIAPLARISRPHVAMITTVAAAHLEAFASVDDIAREKAAIFEGLEPGGVAVIPADLPVTPILIEAAEKAGAAIVTFGATKKAGFRLDEARISGDITIVAGHHGRDRLLFKVQSAGRHFAMNAMGVLAAARALGAETAVAACDLGQWCPPAGRGQRETIVLDIVEDHLTLELLDDAFNANPASMMAALEVLAASKPVDGIGRISQGRRIAFLGDMLELGPHERALHADIAADPSMGTVSVVHCAGPRMRWLHDALPPEKRGEWHATAEALASRAHVLVDAGDVALVKGSKGSK